MSAMAKCCPPDYSVKSVRMSAAASWLLATLVVAGGTFGGAPASLGQSLPLYFDTSHLTLATGTQYVTLNNGTATGSLTPNDVYVTFQGASGTVAAVYQGVSGTLSWTNQDFSWITSNTTKNYTSIMSQSFSVGGLQNQMMTVQNLGASRVTFSYGQFVNDFTNPSNVAALTNSSPIRFTYTEPNYTVSSGTVTANGWDLTNIDQYGGSLQLTSWQGVSGSGAINLQTKATRSTQEMMSRLVTLAGGTASNPVVMSGSGVSRVIGPTDLTTTEFGNMQAYMGAVGTGSSGLASPRLTNLLIDNGALQGPGSQQYSTTASPSAGLSGNTTYNLSYYFTPVVSSTTLSTSGTGYNVVFSGSVVAANNSSGAVSATYSDLTVTVSSGTDGSAMNAFLNTGNASGGTIITLGGGTANAWATLATDFGTGVGPTAAVIAGSTSSIGADYGWAAQRVMGDFQEGVMAGLYGNQQSGTYTYYTTGSTGLAVANSGTAAIGSLRSADWFQNPQFAYTGTAPGSVNTFAREVFLNSSIATNSGTILTGGGVYGAQYDDRFSSNFQFPEYVNTIPGSEFAPTTTPGSITVTFLEAAAVPEPSAVALVVTAAATCGGVAWRRRRRRGGRGA